jgi:hypothetical protein
MVGDANKGAAYWGENRNDVNVRNQVIKPKQGNGNHCNRQEQQRGQRQYLKLRGTTTASYSGEERLIIREHLTRK